MAENVKETALKALTEAQRQCAQAVLSGGMTAPEYEAATGQPFVNYCESSYKSRAERAQALAAAAKGWLAERVASGQISAADYKTIVGEAYAAAE